MSEHDYGQGTAGPEPDPDLTQDPALDPDPEAAEDYADSVGVDPTHEEVDRYLQLEGDAPLGEARPADSSP